MLPIAIFVMAFGISLGTQAQKKAGRPVYVCDSKNGIIYYGVPKWCYERDFKIDKEDGSTRTFYRPIKCPADFSRFEVKTLKQEE